MAAKGTTHTAKDASKMKKEKFYLNDESEEDSDERQYDDKKM